ncbi:hypothetical protein JCM16303_005342 [Sporobolomyces ruberrimus]
MIVPSTAAFVFSLLTLSTALPFTPSPPSSSSSLDSTSNFPSSIQVEQDPLYKLKRRRDNVELDLGEGIVVLDTVNDGSLSDDSSFNNDEEEDEEENVFDPESYDDGGKAVIRNPKVVPNPKNPNFSSSLATATASTSTSTTTTSPAATSTAAGAGGSKFKGIATYYFQGGVAGNCGKVNPDSAMIVALDYRLYGDLSKQSKYCGKSLTIKNTANGKSITATVADSCPTCESKYSLDLSEAAFGAIGDYDTGVLPIEWYWN